MAPMARPLLKDPPKRVPANARVEIR
jgi:hypothetical protein